MSRIVDLLLSKRANPEFGGGFVCRCPFCGNEWGDWTPDSLKKFTEIYPDYPYPIPPIEIMVCERCKEIWILVTEIQELKLILADTWYISQQLPDDLESKAKTKFYRLSLIEKQNELYKLLKEGENQ